MNTPDAGSGGLSRLSLYARFAIVSCVLLTIGAIAIGVWVSKRIEHSVISNTAKSSALYIDGILTPTLRSLSKTGVISKEDEQRINWVIENTDFGRRIYLVKIWDREGKILYSNDHALINSRHDIDDSLAAALSGEVVGEFEDLLDPENEREARVGLPLLEIYAPVRDETTGAVVAVMETYEIAHELRADLDSALRSSWLIVISVSLGIGGFLVGIVRSGSLTIDRQREELELQLAAREELLRQNGHLSIRVRNAVKRASEVNEKYLRRLGAELHDGPAQLLALAALRIDSFAAAESAEARQVESSAVKQAITDALAEIRSLSNGLCLPHVDGLSIDQLANRAVLSHELSTNSSVDIEIDGDGSVVAPHSTNICAFRILIEGLSNAFRHGGGIDQKVRIEVFEDKVSISVSDAGPGMNVEEALSEGERIGLVSMRERVESLGGNFSVDSEIGKGACLNAVLPIGETAESMQKHGKAFGLNS